MFVVRNSHLSSTAEAAEPRRPVVLQVLPSLVAGGVERGAVDVAIALTAAGATAIVASEGGPMEVELQRAGVLHLKLPLASKNPLVMYRNVTRLTRLVESYGVDVIHARSRAPAWSAQAAARRAGCHFVTTFHAPYAFSNPLKKRYNAVMASGERVIAISEYIGRHLLEHYKVEPERLRVIQRGVDLQRFDPDRVSQERVIRLATQWRLPDGVPLVMLPGRLTRWKGQTLLLEAMARLPDKEVCCALIGADQGRHAYRKELEEMIGSLGLSGRAFIFDHCNDMPAAYMLADVVVSASTEPEGFGRVIGEAQAMGRPVVASDHGAVREQVRVDRTAFLFQPGSVDSLSDAIARALALTPMDRKTLAWEAIHHIRQNFSKERMCDSTLEVYAELLAEARRDERHDRAVARRAPA